MTAACNIPNEIQPAIPPGGLFGPDAFIPSWGSPGYKTAPDIAHPMPFPIPIDGPYSAGGGNLPGTRPSPNMPGFGLTAYSYDETVGNYRRSQQRVNGSGSGFFVDVTPPIVPNRHPYVPSKRKKSGSSEEPAMNSPHPTIPGLYYAGGGNYRNAVKGEAGGGGILTYESGKSTRASSVDITHERTGLRSYKENVREMNFESPQVAVAFYMAEMYKAEAERYNMEAKWWGGLYEACKIAASLAIGNYVLGLLGAFSEAGIVLSTTERGFWQSRILSLTAEEGPAGYTLRFFQIRKFFRIEAHSKYGRWWWRRWWPHLQFEGDHAHYLFVEPLIATVISLLYGNSDAKSVSPTPFPERRWDTERDKN